MRAKRLLAIAVPVFVAAGCSGGSSGDVAVPDSATKGGNVVKGLKLNSGAANASSGKFQAGPR